MKFGLGKQLQSSRIKYNYFRFYLKKKLFGFETANNMTRWLDKESLMYILVRNGAKIGENCDIESGLTFHNCKDYSNLIIGNNCHIGKNCFFDLKDQIIIGDNVIISMQYTFITHIDMNKSSLKNLYPAKNRKIIIENSCYIGSNSTLLNDIKIGEKSIIASKSLINQDVEHNTLYGGVPAKKIKDLFE